MEEKLVVTYAPNIILLSFGVSFCGSVSAVSLSEQYRLIRVHSNQLLPASTMDLRLILICMAVAIGTVAVWCMHFIGMGSVILINSAGEQIDFSYDIGLTVASLIIPILFVYAGLLIAKMDRFYALAREDTLDLLVNEVSAYGTRIITNKKMKLFSLFSSLHYLVAAGIMTAAGVCIMHYIGMMSMRFNGRIEWDIGIVFSSVLVSIIASIAAFWILFRFLSLFPRNESFRCLCALMLGLAVTSMHYTGMAGATYYYNPNINATFTNVISSEKALYLSLIIGLTLSWILLIIALRDARLWIYKSSDIVERTDEFIRKAATLTSTPETLAEFFSKYEAFRRDGGTDVFLSQAAGAVRRPIAPSKRYAPMSNVQPI